MTKNKQQNVFYPKASRFTRKIIAEVLSAQVTDGWDLNFIKPNDARLTDELCQLVADKWMAFDEGGASLGPLWEDEDTFTKYYERKFKKIFTYTSK